MEDREEIRQLLREIRDAQREQLAEYRRVTERSLDLQQRAVARQEQMGRLWKQWVLAGGMLVAILLALLVYLLARPSEVADPSWIRPGKVAWDWWNAWNLHGVGFKSGVNMPKTCLVLRLLAANLIRFGPIS